VQEELVVTRSALVTGASRGIGLGLALRLASRGHGLTITARDAGQLDEVAAELRGTGASEVIAVPGDWSDEDQVERVLDRHEDTFGEMAVLALAAGVGSAGPIAGYPMTRYDKQFAVNTRGSFQAISRALPMLRKAAARDLASGARIIALASIGGVYTERDLAVYGASKAALISMCRSVNLEESDGGVSATAIAPGYVDTDMSAWVHDDVAPEQMISVADVVELADALLRLSSRAVVPELVISRAGTSGYVA
jgi:3-oxoacyl-[acyl-carrier protein] reductase